MSLELFLCILVIAYVAIKILLWWADDSTYRAKPKNDSQEEWERKQKKPRY